MLLAVTNSVFSESFLTNGNKYAKTSKLVQVTPTQSLILQKVCSNFNDTSKFLTTVAGISVRMFKGPLA